MLLSILRSMLLLGVWSSWCAVSAAKSVLLGLQIPHSSDGPEISSNLMEYVNIAEASRVYFEGLGVLFSVFACFQWNITSEQLYRPSVILRDAKIPFFLSPNPSGDLCTLDYPELERYDALVHADVRRVATFFPMSSSRSYDALYFAVPAADVVLAKRLLKSMQSIPSMADEAAYHPPLLSTLIIDNLITTDFSLLDDMLVTVTSYPRLEANGEYALFAPAVESSTVQSSGPVSVLWPLDGSELVALVHPEGAMGGMVGAVHTAVLRMDLDYVASPEESFYFRYRTFINETHMGTNEVVFNMREAVGNEVDIFFRLTFRSSQKLLPTEISILSSNREEIASFKLTLKVIQVATMMTPAPLVEIHPLLSISPRREQFGRFLNGLGLKGTLVEVGFHDLVLASNVLQHWDGKHYVMIDNHASDENFQLYAASPGLVFQRASPSFKGPSTSNVLLVDGGADVVCISGSSYHSALMEMQLWWSKIKVGGLMYVEYTSGREYMVGPAVDEFARRLNIPVFKRKLTMVEKNKYWYLMKTA